MNKFEERESVVLENHGQKFFGIFHKPLSHEPFPTVLMCHGLAGHKSGKYRLYVILAEHLSRAGIATFRIDFRGSGDSEGDFSDMTLEGETSDALIALDYLRHRPDVDNDRMGIFGRSVGGAVTMMAARKDGRIKSLATWAPLHDGEQWEALWGQLHAPYVPEEFRREHMNVNGQVPGDAFFKQLFAMRLSDDLKYLENVPLLHIHGELDNIITIQHADRYQQDRLSAKAENKFIRLPKSDHDFSETKEQQLAINETVEWFKRTL